MINALLAALAYIVIGLALHRLLAYIIPDLIWEFRFYQRDMTRYEYGYTPPWYVCCRRLVANKMRYYQRYLKNRKEFPDEVKGRSHGDYLQTYVIGVR